ncbi:AfsR/SARP family transcriptional regulator [Lentzea terrae]|uniref:AfsR/SARP family transcriptional regulator n=1 Tax=Lentzea terrae TaxID=2200761 RepID=UPI000DD458BA|nr:AfsR/SARP family transcriptional regulator [Lentzea terrae]
MQFLLLGDLEVFANGEGTLLLAPKLRAILTLLLVAGGRTVPIHAFVDELWASRPPATVMATMQTYIYQLRKIFNADTGLTGAAITTTSSGYALEISPDQVDVHVFERRLAEGRTALAAGAYRSAAEHLDAALAVWRSSPLANVPKGPYLEAYATRLTEARAQAVELRIEAYLQMGRHREVVAELKSLAVENPLHEGFQTKLMTALHRCGRRHEALEVYARLRRTISTELGLEPSAAAQEVHRALLTGESEPAPPMAAAPVAWQPAQLPPDTADFAGRLAAVAQVRAELDGHGPRTAPRIVVLTGMPGVGKTVLAVHTAHLLRQRYPDGQFFANLGRTADAGAVLESFLHGIGLTGDQVPADLDGRSRLFRSWCADREVLVVLDDVSSARQVRDLLPGGNRCGVLLSSRAPLYGLSGARTVELGPMPAEDALALLETMTGRRLVGDDRITAHRIVDLCDRIPAAVRVIGDKLALSTRLSLDSVFLQLSTPEGKLALLESSGFDLPATLGEAYWALDSSVRHALNLLSTRAKPCFSRDDAAELLSLCPAYTEVTLSSLLDAGFLLTHERGFRLPGLVRLIVHNESGMDVPAQRGAPEPSGV